VLEIGPGPGTATRHLLASGARVVAVEPDAALAEHLVATAGPAAALDVRIVTFEDAALPDHAFDLAVAATSFHWVDPTIGLAEVARVLRPGGWFAMWWNAFGDPARPDPIHLATHELMDPLPGGPSGGEQLVPFSLDRDARLAELRAAGFEAGEAGHVTRTLTMTAAETRALYATYSPVNRLDPGPREALLDAVAEVATRELDDRVELHVITAFYSARTKPAA
jgi:SAM-dependent methyltransferase